MRPQREKMIRGRVEKSMKSEKDGEAHAEIGETGKFPQKPQLPETAGTSLRKNAVIIKQCIREIEFLHSVFVDKTPDTE